MPRQSTVRFDDPRIEVALISLGASVALVLTKLLAYLFTGSLSVLAEFLHSSLDLLATIVTLSAVYYAARPPDSGHPYGHGKAENLGGLAGALLILATSVWIFYEGVDRLLKAVSFTPSLVAVIVMAASMGVDYWRSRALSSAAKRYHSQALEADALHFSSDLISSASVLSVVALGMVLHSFPSLANAFLVWLDVGVAMFVAAYFGWSSYRLSKRAINELLDRAPAGMLKEAEMLARKTAGVLDVKGLRSRRSGARIFVDMTIAVAEGTDISEAHETATSVERSLKERFGEIDLVIHIEPASHEDIKKAVRATALNVAGVKGIHSVMVAESDGSYSVRLHISVDAHATVAEAHRIADELEERLKASDPSITSVNIHMEPKVNANDFGLLASVKALAAKMHGVQLDNVSIENIGRVTYVDIKCRAKATAALADTHDVVTLIEDGVRELVGGDVYVTVHTEPDLS